MKTQQTAPSQMKLEIRHPNDDRPPLPEGWVWTTIGEICQVNPRMMRPEEFTDESSVSFVPMAAVDDVSGMIVEPQIRPVGEVWKGYTRFAENDVIFAKITPCMENGKVAIARNLVNGVGLGSTEFHVLRSSGAVLPEWVFHFVRQNSFRGDAAARMTGTAGQLRVPATFMKESFIPIAPLPEQHRIVEAIETQFTRLDAAVAALHRVKANLARYKASVLKAACEGRLVSTDAALHHARFGFGRRGEAAPDDIPTYTAHQTAEAPGRADIGAGLPRPSSTDAHHRGGGEATGPHVGGKGKANPQSSVYAEMRGDVRRGEANPQSSVYAEMRGDARRGEATPQSPMTAMGNGNAETPDPAEPGGDYLAPSTVSHIGGKGEATPQSPMTAMGNGDAETPDPAEPGGGCLAPTDATPAAYEPADVLLRHILTERRARWMAENPGKRYVEPSGPDTSGLPDLPEGWCWASVQQLSTKVVDGTHHTPTYTDSGIAFISVKDVRNGQIYFDECKYICEEEHNQLIKRCHPEYDDILITKSGTIGRIAAVKTERPFSLFVSVALIKTLKNTLDQNFLRFALEYYILSINIQQDIKGGVIKNLHLEDLRIVPLRLPPLAEQHRIVAEVERRLSVVAEVEASVDANLVRAERLRQAILREAFAGRLVPRGNGDMGMDVGVGA